MFVSRFSDINIWNVQCFTLIDGITFFALGWLAYFFLAFVMRALVHAQRVSQLRQFGRMLDHDIISVLENAASRMPTPEPKREPPAS